MIDEGTLAFDELLRLSEFRSRIYGFLSSLCIRTPSLDFVHRLLCEDVSLLLSKFPFDHGESQEIGEGVEDIKKFIRTFGNQAVEEVHQSLSVEYTRLFRGIRRDYGPPPYESVYTNREQVIMGKAVFEVQKEYAEAGVGMPADCNEPPDHIAVELDFMRFLVEKESESWSKQEWVRGVDYLTLEHDFLGKHIMKWTPRFCEMIAVSAELDFYRGVARVIGGFIIDDHKRTRSLLNALEQ